MEECKMRRKNQWKGGPRSRRSYIMDYHRQSKEEGAGVKGVVRPHYRKKKKGGFTKVRYHKRRK